MTVTIAIPFYGDRDMLTRCVKSLLQQTHRDLRVLVIGDGQRVPRLPRDARITTYRLPENRGAYYARAVALAATTTEHHAIVDADDWVDPEWLETMLATGGAAVQHGARITHWAGIADQQVQAWRKARRPAQATLTHYTSHTGVYLTERLREVGGYSPAYRVGYDSLLCGLLRMTGSVEIVDRPMYHRLVRPDSLTQAPETSMQSPARHEVRVALAAAHAAAWRVRRDVAKVRAIAETLTPPDLWAEIAEHATKVNR